MRREEERLPWPQRRMMAVLEGRETARNPAQQERLAELDRLRRHQAEMVRIEDERVREQQERAREFERVALVRLEEELLRNNREWLVRGLDGGFARVQASPQVRVNGYTFPDDLDTLTELYKGIGALLEERMQNT